MQSSALILRDLSKQKNRSQKSCSQDSTHYHILQVSETATIEMIRNAYMQQIRRCRTDVSDAVNHYQAVLVAYRTLKNPKSRQAYDTWLAETRAKSIKSMENLIATLNSAIDDLSSLNPSEEQDANHKNPLAILYTGLGLSYAILVISIIAALCYPESMLGESLGIVGFFATCGSNYALFRYCRQEDALWKNNFLEPAKNLISHHQHIENFIAFHRERIPKLTYEPKQTETMSSTTAEGLGEPSGQTISDPVESFACMSL